MLKNRAGPSSAFLKKADRALLPLPDKKGSYVLILRNNTAQTIHVGRLGALNFREGFYAYAGSAMGGLSKRVSRYLKEIKNPFWHIDAIMPARLWTLRLFKTSGGTI